MFEKIFSFLSIPQTNVDILSVAERGDIDTNNIKINITNIKIDNY